MSYQQKTEESHSQHDLLHYLNNNAIIMTILFLISTRFLTGLAKKKLVKNVVLTAKTKAYINQKDEHQRGCSR